jgi:hypothetical protein
MASWNPSSFLSEQDLRGWNVILGKIKVPTIVHKMIGGLILE